MARGLSEKARQSLERATGKNNIRDFELRVPVDGVVSIVIEYYPDDEELRKVSNCLREDLP